MRYEDASHTGAFQGSEPIANDDADTLTAGARAPATGNVITGEGTQYGAAGADQAAGAQITAVAGKGGEDTSFSGGKLSVGGEFGRLSIDAEGNYAYQANKDAPENVRDRFTYTLADSQGNSDSAALIVEIGKTPVVIKADAQQIVPGPDGVVTLPPGVELSDVHVVGRNLVVDLPDGTQLIIIDGAVFVPQLVIDGVSVPATNVATLLIGQEPQPAAGETPLSGGGNFALPPPPLDPGVPLGDLIPPTEYDYIPPEPEEVFDILDREPEIFVQPDGQPASVAAVDEVDERGLPTRNGGEPEGTGEGADGNASNDSDPSEATAGLIVYDSPDGVDSITINGQVVSFVGQVINGTYGSLEITSIADGQIGYLYTLDDNIDHSDGAPDQDDFSVVLTDNDGDQASATLTINILDDVPTAVNDTDSIPAGQYGPATGNVLTDAAPGDAGDSDNGADTVGADDASITSVSSVNVPANSDSSGPFVVNGQYGVLTLQTDGSYSYVRNEGTPGGVTDVFNYALTDGDGDVDTATLTIDIGDATPLTGQNPTALLDDDALPNGNPGGVDDDVDAANLNGNLAGSGGDGPLTFDLLLTGAPAGFSYVDGPGGAVHVMQGGTHVLTITINSATGAYTVSQINPIDHPAGSNENNAQFTINYTVTDQDGDSANGTLGINVDDDTPEMNRADVNLPTLNVDETNLAVNASADFSTVFAGDYGADGAGTTSYAVSVVNGTDSGLVDVATGDPILLFNNGGVVEGRVGGAAGAVAFTVSVNGGTGVVTLDQVRALDHPVNPNPDDTVSPNPTSIQFTATITDGDGDPASLTVNIGGQLSFDDDGPTVDPTLNADATVTVDESLPSSAPGIDTGGITKGDDPDLAGGVAIGQANSGGAIVDANAVFGADGPAAGGGLSYALSITNTNPGVTLTDGTTITMQLVGGVIVGVVDSGPFDGQAAFAIAINPTTGVVTVEQYLSLDHPVNPDPNDPLGLGDNTVGVTVTATDGDGDPVTSDAVDISGQITFLDDGPAIDPDLNAQATVTVDESAPSTAPAINTGAIAKGDDPDLGGGLALGQGNSGVAIVDASAVFGADGPAVGGGLTYALSITNVSSGVTLTDGSAINLQLVGGVIVGVVAAGPFAGQAAFAIAIDANTGVVSVEQYLSLDHPVNPNPNDPLGLGDNTIGVTVSGTDGDGDLVTSGAVDISNQITFLDDGPTIDPVLDREATVTVDESLPSTAPAINTGAIAKGDDPDLAGGFALGQANSGGAIVDANAVFGADGAAAGGGISYALSITNAASGLTLTDGSAINLQLVGGVVVGVVAGGPFAGQAAFAIAINPTTGVVSVEQYLSLDHPVNPDPNDPLGLGDDTVAVTVTATDGDGDSVTSDAIDISNNITFLDDGPAVDPVLNANATVTVDESLPSTDPTIDTGAIAKGNDPDLAGGVALGFGTSGAAVVNANAVFGADGPAAAGSIVHSLSITNADSGVTLTDGTPIDLVMQGGVVVGVVDGGPFNGQAAFAIAINPTTGVVTVEQYLSLDHPVNPNPNDPLGLGDNTVAVTVTATDGDGDPITSGGIDISGQITFLDDGPSVAPVLNAQATVTVDESLPSNDPAINTGAIVKGDDPDLAGGLALGQANSGGAIVNANAVFGADGPAAGGGISYALVLGASDTPLTLTDGSTVTLQLVGGVVVGVVDNGPFAGQAAFALAINPTTGVVSVEQYLSLDHPVNPNPNDPLGLGPNTVGVTVTATDGDGDPVTSGAVDISSQITFLDDGPTVNPALSTQGGATVDESLPSNIAGIDTLAVVKGNDPDLSDATGTAIGQASTAGTVVNANAVFGADGPAAGGGLSYALTVLNLNSGLTLTDGSAINLVQLANGNVVGVVQGGAFNGQAAFAFQINSATGVVTVEQYLSLDHPVNPNPNDPLGLSSGSLGATVTATDGDGDPVTSSAVDISSKFTFLDDGPTADPTLNSNATVTVDESLPSSAPAINTGAIVKGNDPDLSDATGTALGQANSGSAIVNANAVFGADGPAAGGGVSYALSILNANSGLTLTDGTPINLQMQGGVIVGVVNGGPFNGQAAFAIAINPTTGVVSVEQYLSLDHPVNPNPNDPLSFGGDIVGVTVTATDGDGDPVTSGAVDIGGQITFLDDGPSAANDVDTIVGGNGPATGNVITGVDLVGGDGNATDGSADTLGADGVGAITFIASNNVPANTDGTYTAGNLVVAGQYGVLTINANGNYSYLRNDGTPGGVNDVFTYTLTDGDGDPVTATLTIAIEDNVPNLPDPALVRLDDDALAGGNPGGTNDDPNSAGLPGQLTGSGGDGPLTYNFTGVNTLPAGFSVNPVDASTVQIVQAGVGVVLTVTLNNSTGEFNVVQNNPIDHLNADTENNFDFSIGVEVEDNDGDVEPAAITINVDDDTPVLTNVQAGDDVTLDETSFPFPISATSDTAVITATQAFGADGPADANSVVYGLAIVGGSPEPSGLFTAVGNFPITLVAIDSDTVQGQYTNGGTQVAFTIQMNANGTVTLTQNVPLEHNTDGAPGAPHNDALDLTGLINATITITDDDGDTATASAPIGDNLVFLDDGPDAQVDGQATLDQLVLDETRPVGTETDGDSAPAGLATVQSNFANNFVAPIDYGADGAGTVAYSLVLSGNGIGSGLFALDPTDTETAIDGFGKGAEITLSINPAGTLITGAVGPTTYFTIEIDPATGVVTFTQVANIWHANTANDDDTSSLTTAAAANIQVVQTVTDSDGDFDSAAINVGQGVFHIEDDGPQFGAVTEVLDMANDGNPGVGDLVIDLGTDGPSANNNVISLDNFNVKVNGVDLDPSAFELVEGAETAATASYTFSFEYDTGAGGTATANGTLVFDKVAGTYTVDLDGPIAGFSILQTATGTLFQGYELGTSNPDGSQPAISVTQIQGTPGDPDPSDLFIQFTSVAEPSSGTGTNNLQTIDWDPDPDAPNPSPELPAPGAWTSGELFNQAAGWVSTSGSANGTNGDTIQGGEVLDFTLVQGANPTGILAQPETFGQASSMFLKFDGIGTGEDMIVILKLYDPVADSYTTKAVMIQNTDIQHGPGNGPGIFSGISLDNNDGLVIIESNDYNGVGENWVIVGAQIAGSDEGVTGTAINLNGAVGDAGASSGTQAFSTDTNDGPFKISSIGFVTENVQDQSAAIDFDVTITEADGDSETQHVTVNVGEQPADAFAATSFSADSEDQQVQKSAANSNTLTMAAAVAAAGMSESAAATPPADDSSSDQPADDSASSSQMVGTLVAADDGEANSSAVAGTTEQEAEQAPASSAGHGRGNANGHDAKLDSDSGHQAAEESSHVAANDQGPADQSAHASPVAPAVAMISAEALQAAGLGGEGKGSSVEQVIADALGHGSAPTLDAVLQGLPGGGNGELAAIANLASPAAGHVPGWDMGAQSGFAMSHDVMFKMGAEMLHHDAVQPAVNG